MEWCRKVNILNQPIIEFILHILLIRWNENIGVYRNFEDIDIEKSCPLGENLIKDVESEAIACQWVKMKSLLLPNTT